jgi:hypothetical protein
MASSEESVERLMGNGTNGFNGTDRYDIELGPSHSSNRYIRSPPPLNRYGGGENNGNNIISSNSPYLSSKAAVSAVHRISISNMDINVDDIHRSLNAVNTFATKRLEKLQPILMYEITNDGDSVYKNMNLRELLHYINDEADAIDEEYFEKEANASSGQFQPSSSGGIQGGQGGGDGMSKKRRENAFDTLKEEDEITTTGSEGKKEPSPSVTEEGNDNALKKATTVSSDAPSVSKELGHHHHHPSSPATQSDTEDHAGSHTHPSHRKSHRHNSGEDYFAKHPESLQLMEEKAKSLKSPTEDALGTSHYSQNTRSLTSSPVPPHLKEGSGSQQPQRRGSKITGTGPSIYAKPFVPVQAIGGIHPPPITQPQAIPYTDRYSPPGGLPYATTAAGMEEEVFEAVNILRLRDLRRLDTVSNPNEEKSILIRRHAIIFAMDPIRAVVMAKRVILIVPDGADSLISILDQYMKGILLILSDS